jgi:hypothetical protein
MVHLCAIYLIQSTRFSSEHQYHTAYIGRFAGYTYKLWLCEDKWSFDFVGPTSQAPIGILFPQILAKRSLITLPTLPSTVSCFVFCIS